MLIQQPPFALRLPVFRFKGLAAQAGRAALGGDREVVLACFMVARLGAGLLPPVALAHGDTAARAASTRNWLASLTLPAPVRASALGAMDAAGSGDTRSTAAAIGRLAETVSGWLDDASLGELRELSEDLEAVTPAHSDTGRR